MIKTHLFAAYASCALLWCSMATDLAAQDLSQTGKQLAFRKANIPIEGEYIDAVFYTDSSAQELRPKIIIRKESVDFMTRAGAIRHRVITHSGPTATITCNGQFICFYKEGFCFYKDTGDLLWQDAPEEDEDGPGRLYKISSLGLVCNVLKQNGKIIFHSQQGTVMAVHAITDGMSRTLDGEWSPDGQYFLASASITSMLHDNRIFLFDAQGAKLWEKRLDEKWAVEIEFSPKSKWIFLRYRDFNDRTFGNTLLATQDGAAVHDLIQNDLLFPTFSTDERYFLARGRHRREGPGQKLVLFDIETGTALFEIFLAKPIIDYVVFPDEVVIYVLHQSEIVKLDVSGAVIGAYAFEKLEAPLNILRLQDGSTPNQVLIRGQGSYLYLNPSK
ncbi:hypothetical protein FBQ85_07785 [Cytophagia bacterium CHB2]|nr:hypothetical protein [Cytophagia bacterium CHB2]